MKHAGEQEQPKKAYQAPKLEEFGSIQDLTEVGPPPWAGGPISGSIDPPGLVNNPGLPRRP